jgi:hypothetical protein
MWVEVVSIFMESYTYVLTYVKFSDKDVFNRGLLEEAQSPNTCISCDHCPAPSSSCKCATFHPWLSDKRQHVSLLTWCPDQYNGFPLGAQLYLGCHSPSLCIRSMRLAMGWPDRVVSR